jgi:Flp pilus assembly protein TadB
MNSEAMQATLLLGSALCAGGAASALTLYSLRAYKAARAEGLRIQGTLLYDTTAKQSPLPPLLRVYGFGVAFLPLIRRLQRRDSFGVRGRLRDYEALLVKAGLRPYITPEHFLALVFLWAVACGALMLAFSLVIGLVPAAAALFVPAGLAAGLAVPHSQLKQLASERAAQIEKRLPYATEFILLAMEANASFPMALGIYCHEMESDPLADELAVVAADIEKGLSTQEALAGLGRRIPIDLLSSFILAVNTGLATGQPITDVMRVQAAVTRRKRYESAEEIAKKASTKATFPLIIIVVAVLVLLVAPLMMNFSNSFF